MPSAALSTAVAAERAPALVAVLLVVGLAAACNPRVQLEAPKDPIVINLNVKIEQEVRVRIERDLDDLLDDPELFGG
jgi:hypothetical protein